MAALLRWILLAAGSGWACHLAVIHDTPIDRALPLLAVVATLLAAVSHGVIVLAVPLLIVTEVAVPLESARLLALGAIMAAAFVIALAASPQVHLFPRGRRHAYAAALVITLSALVVLRWIPYWEVFPGRELALLALAAATVIALGSTPFAIAVAVVAGLLTPAVPLRTFGLPIAVLVVALVSRRFLRPPWRLTWPSSMVLAFVMLFFAWSGVVARGLPWLLGRVAPPPPAMHVGQALRAGEETVLAVPDGAEALVVSGANAARLRRGVRLGTIEPGGIEISIGDAADWGYMRREQFFRSRNPLPRDSAGTLRGYGQTAWVDGAGRVPLPAGAESIRVTADPSLGGAALQVERFELHAR